MASRALIPVSFLLSPPQRAHSPPPFLRHLPPLPSIASKGARAPLPAIKIRRNSPGGACFAVAKSLGMQQPSAEEGPKEAEERAEYDWREEWYPLYLTRSVPDDAPLALAVFHKQLVLYRDGEGIMRCYEDRCPHRLARLSEGQLQDGRLECLYHGWQFEGEGRCVRIPQLPEGAKIPRSACARSYRVRESQGVVWVWMSEKTEPDDSKLPFFEFYGLPGFSEFSSIHELPYDHSILLENLMDPAHVNISHDRTDGYSKREDAAPLVFDLTERTLRGFACTWRNVRTGDGSVLRFRAPCAIESNKEFRDKKGNMQRSFAVFLCRPAGQGRAMLILRFGLTAKPWLFRLFPEWFLHGNSSRVLEQDMGFLSSQNEVLLKEKLPTGELYINLKSSDTLVAEYRKWVDRVGHGMPYHIGHSTISLPDEPAVVEHAPAGMAAADAASLPAKGSVGTPHGPNMVNRYYRHIVHCKVCRKAVAGFERWRGLLLFFGAAWAAAAIMASSRQWKGAAVAAAAACLAGSYACNCALGYITNNFIRKHRR